MADSNNIIAAQIRVDTGNSNANVSALNKNLAETKTSLKDTGTVAASTGKAVEGSAGSFGKLREQISATPGPLGQATEGVGKLTSGFKALLANPVVLTLTAIVGALGFLYKSFTNTFEGGQKVQQVFAGIKAAADIVLDRVFALGGALIKFFSGDFKGAYADAKKAVTGVGDEIVGVYKKTAEITKKLQDIHKEELADDLDKAKRAKSLALLREQLNDESVPIAEKRKAAKALRDEEVKNAQDDLDRAKRKGDLEKELLRQGTDGALKHRDEINKIDEDILNTEKENALEGVRTNKVIRNLDKQAKAEDKAAAAEEAAKAKEERQKLVEFTNKLTKIQQDNELAIIRDSYEKEKKVLENKIADDKRANDVSFKDKKITREQYNKLNAALDEQANLQLSALQDKHNKELAEKDAEFQKDLNAINNKIKLDGLTDARAQEREQLKATYDERLADLTKRYKDDNTKLQILKQALDKQNAADQAKLDAKFAKEDEKKETDLELSRLKRVVDNIKNSFAIRLKAVDDEQVLIKKQFDDKIITEQEYNDKVQGLSDARKTIREQEQKSNEEIAGAIGKTFGNLSDLAGKQTVLGKAFAIAQTAIDTYQSAIASYKSLAGIPVVGPALGAIAAAAAVASGIAAVKKIVSVQVPGQGSSGGAVPSGLAAPAAPIAPTQVSTTFTQQQNPTSGTPTSIRAYMVESESRSATERAERLERAARLGGGDPGDAAGSSGRQSAAPPLYSPQSPPSTI